MAEILHFGFYLCINWIYQDVLFKEKRKFNFEKHQLIKAFHIIYIDEFIYKY